MIKNDKMIMTELAKEVNAIAHLDIMDERRELWSKHNTFKKGKVPIYIRDGVWSNEIIKPLCECEDEFLREKELFLRKMIYQHELKDDFVIEPWITLSATKIMPGVEGWGLAYEYEEANFTAGARKYAHPLKNIEDLSMLTVPKHTIDEVDTNRNLEILSEAVSGAIEIDIDRSPKWWNFEADISTRLGYLRGMEEMMWDMYDHPNELHKLLAFMRDGILKAQDEAEKANDITLSSTYNQSMAYIEGLEGPRANSEPVKRSDIWVFSAAQEFDLISPAMHKEFLLDYQKPIIEKFAYSSYGCCEDLAKKIDIFSEIKNLRRIAVAPFSDVREFSENLEGKYIASWRPDPAKTVCLGFDRDAIKKMMKEAKKAFEDNDCIFDICLKDVQTIQNDYYRQIEFVKIVREVME